MKRVLLLIRNTPHYRYDGFESCFKRLGYQIVNKFDARNLCDVLVVWNRHGYSGSVARNYEKAGLPIIVAENGYIGTDDDGHHLFALALNHHNGLGDFPIGNYSRWEGFNIPVSPWRVNRGRDLLLLPQRGIGPPGIAMPRNWVDVTTSRLRSQKRFIRVRKHPGTIKNVQPLDGAFNGVHMAVIWGSGAGIKSIVAGLPVCHELRGWIGSEAATMDINKPFIGDRTAMLTRVAWSQWRISEIASGEPVDRLLLHAGVKECV